MRRAAAPVNVRRAAVHSDAFGGGNCPACRAERQHHEPAADCRRESEERETADPHLARELSARPERIGRGGVLERREVAAEDPVQHEAEDDGGNDRQHS